MAAFNISYIYQAIDKFTPVAEKINRAIASNKKSFEQISILGKTMQGIGTKLTLGLTLPIAGLGAWAVKSASDFESLRAEFGVMLGDVAKGGKMFADIRDFAARTPFQLEGLASAAKTMMAMGVESQDVVSTLNMLGDVAGNSQEKLNSLALVYGQIRTKGKLMGDDLRQLYNVGFNPYEVLAKTMGVTVAELQAKGQLSFEGVKKAFEIATSKGGKFYQNMITQSTTFSGLISTLKDNLNITMATIGEKMLPTLKKMAIYIINLTGKIVEFVDNNPKIVKMGMIFAGILAVLGPVIFAFGTLLTILPAMTMGFKLFWLAATGPVGWITAGILLLISLGTYLYIKYKPFRDLVNSTWEGIKIVGKYLYDYVYQRIILIVNVFKFLISGFKAVIGFANNLYEKFEAVRVAVQGIAKAFVGSVKASTLGLVSPTENLAADTPAKQNMQESFMNAIIKIVAPKDTVKSAKVSKDFAPNLNVGLNLMETQNAY